MTEPKRTAVPAGDHTPTVAIVGGGASGTILAIHLLMQATTPFEITIYEPRPEIGGGIAYSTAAPEHRVNVPAGRMSVFADDPLDFHRWVESGGIAEKDPAAFAGPDAIFPQRALFGRYLRERLREAADRSEARVTVVQRELTFVRRENGRFRFDATTRAADLLVVATGNPLLVLPAALQQLAGDSRVIADSNSPGALDAIGPDDRVVVVGTGLTMGDIVATRAERGHRGPTVALSRRGLVSRPGLVRAASTHEFPRDPVPSTALSLLRAFRRQVEQHHWRDVVDGARNAATPLWRALPPGEQRRFLRHLRSIWEVHRFTMSPQTTLAVAEARESGRLSVLAGRIIAAESARDGVAIRVRSRDGAEQALRGDYVVNATGPAFGQAISANALLGDLQRGGLIMSDPLGLGIATNALGQAIGASQSTGDVFVVGPLARGAYGELTGIREISAQALSVASQIDLSFRPAGRFEHEMQRTQE